MSWLLCFLLLSANLYAQISVPTMTVKKRHGQSATFSWSYNPSPDYPLNYFSIKATDDLNKRPIEVKQVPATARQAVLTVQYSPMQNKIIYYTICAVLEGSTRESLFANTVAAERIGPPPN